jgi:hypothetical protein
MDCYDVLRVQTKLGNSLVGTSAQKAARICHITAEEIANRFGSHLSLAKRALDASSIQVGQMYHYLATTRQVTPEALKVFQGRGVTVLNSRWLREHVWPPWIHDYL